MNTLYASDVHNLLDILFERMRQEGLVIRVAEMNWLNYPFINLSHVCRLLWGSSDRHITARLAYRRKNPASWMPEELEKLEEIRRSFAKQLEENQPVNFL